ncbi:MAG: hypothetical protein HY320_13390 [Armatimonadetes bacterium]|nr:hypothetical protein [Armatimonadota bacterium]
MCGRWATRRARTAFSLALLVTLWAAPAVSRAQAPAPAPTQAPGIPAWAMIRRVQMKDAATAETFRQKLEQFKSVGLFRVTKPGPDGKPIIWQEVIFLTSGNELLIAGDPERVDPVVETVRLMAYLYERPRAHLLLNLRVVQITGPANAEVIQMADAVRALVESQRDEIVRTLGDLEAFLRRRIADRSAPTTQLVSTTKDLMPALVDPNQPLTVPSMLLILLLDRVASQSTATKVSATAGESDRGILATQEALLALPELINTLSRDPQMDPASTALAVQPALALWRERVVEVRDRFRQYVAVVEKTDDSGVAPVREALAAPSSGVPDWLALRISRSLATTQQVFPQLAKEHALGALRAVSERFDQAARRAEGLAKELEQALSAHAAATPDTSRGLEDRLVRVVLAIKAMADDLVPPPLAMYEMVTSAVDTMAPRLEQVRSVFEEYCRERRRVEAALAGLPVDGIPNYTKLQGLEAALNLWLRRVSEAMSRALDTYFYSRYANELRLLADRKLGRSSDRDLLDGAPLDSLADVARDVVLADGSANVFVSNSISMQFATETASSVSATVQAELPQRQTIQERMQQAAGSIGTLNALQQAAGVDAQTVIKTLLAGGEPVPVRDGINLTATPSIGFDGGTVTLQLSANQTLEPVGPQVVERVTNHTIQSAAVTALSYEPMVLSTLTSVVNYYKETGGIPILRKVPVVKQLVNDIPLKPFKVEKKARGIYQSSVIILEPVVIPTVEDLVRYHSGWTPEGDPNTAVALARAAAEEEARKKTEQAAAPAGAPGAPLQAAAPAQK